MAIEATCGVPSCRQGGMEFCVSHRLGRDHGSVPRTESIPESVSDRWTTSLPSASGKQQGHLFGRQNGESALPQIASVWPPNPPLFANREVLEEQVGQDANSKDDSSFSFMQVPRHKGHVALSLLSPFIDIDEEKFFGNYMGQMLSGEVSPEECILRWMEYCWQQAAAIRHQALEQRPEDSICDGLSQFADFWDLEGATWSLVWHLYRSGPTPLHLIPAQFRKLSTSQQLAHWVTDHEDLKRCAKVVAWLEDLQRSAMVSGNRVLTESQAVNRIKEGCAVWRESATWVNTQASDHLVTNLDPDAPTRQQKLLAPGDAKWQDQLNMAVWMLIRAGRMEKAQELCAKAGQPWRAASLSGCGPLGPLPLGHTVTSDVQDDFDLHLVEEFHQDQIGAEVDLGVDREWLQRNLFRWACAQIASQTKSSPAARGVSFESAVYGVLCGDVDAMLPACQTWEDAVWAHCRAWLELTSETTILQHKENSLSSNSNSNTQAVSSPRSDSYANLDRLRKLEVPDGLLAQFLPKSKVIAGGDASISDAFKEGLEVCSGKWPLQRLTASLPENFTGIFTTLEGDPDANIRQECQKHFRVVQRLLICDQMPELLESLSEWHPGAPDPEEDTGPWTLPNAINRSLARFSAHFIIIMQALGKLSPDNSPANCVQRLLDIYIGTLISRGAYEFVAPCCCHVPRHVREWAFRAVFRCLEEDDDASRREFYQGADKDFTAWRQELESQWPVSTDIDEFELHRLAMTCALDARSDPGTQPHTRLKSTEWLFIAFQSGFQGNYDPDAARKLVEHYTSSMEFVLKLIREFVTFFFANVACNRYMLDLARRLASLVPKRLKTVVVEEEGVGGRGASLVEELDSWIVYLEIESECDALLQSIANRNIKVLDGRIHGFPDQAGRQLMLEKCQSALSRIEEELMHSHWMLRFVTKAMNGDMASNWDLTFQLGDLAVSKHSADMWGYKPVTPDNAHLIMSNLQERLSAAREDYDVEGTIREDDVYPGIIEVCLTGEDVSSVALVADDLINTPGAGVPPCAVITINLRDGKTPYCMELCRRVCLSRMVGFVMQLREYLAMSGADMQAKESGAQLLEGFADEDSDTGRVMSAALCRFVVETEARVVVASKCEPVFLS
ncbi:unnamed protein product [Ostreobium quekettii]|uniref:Nuclear pore complex protein n=1 Tax=Ostreobium quekettii TaxID=121088 RepID=A0A8S1JBE1_9CHLO|nr:unnamed protein product [Ostreobium quekettii]